MDRGTTTMQRLPGDEARQVMWRFAARTEIQELLRATRGVARGTVARLVAAGGRATNEWTPAKQALIDEFDRAGISSACLDRRQGGSIDGPKNLALALAAFELAWVDAGAATVALGHWLALAAFRLFGTPGQCERYPGGATADGGPMRRGAFVLTEPIPFAGVETGLLAGTVRVAEWRDGVEPVLHVQKRGRFITNMALADFAVAAVDSADERIKGSCLVVLEREDPGLFDRGTPTRKLVHQLASTSDPVFDLRLPAGRIVGGYDVRDGVIVPRHDHAEIVEAVFRRARVSVASMTSAKLLSAVEPILRYQRRRFRGARAASPGSPRYELGLQQREDVLHRLVEIWAAGEASASLAFAAARSFDEVDASASTATVTASSSAADVMGGVLGPACKLWNTGHGAAMMREAVSLLGGYGVTEDSPGFLGYKWMDAQLEATYEGPEAVQRRQLAVTMTSEVVLARFRDWVVEMREIAARRPGTGACTLASAMELWLWTLRHLQRATDANGARLYDLARQGVTFPLADALCWLLASRFQILDVLELEAAAGREAHPEADLAATARFLTDLCHVQAARAGGEVARIAAELVHGYNRHPAWDAEGCACCYGEADLAALEQMIPGIESTAGTYDDVVAADGSHRAKAGPCVRFQGLDDFNHLRNRLDGCLTGARLAKDRAAAVLKTVAISEAPDYPV